MYGPSHEAHCDPCLFQKVPEQNVSERVQLLEAQEVKLLAGRLATEQDLDLPPAESTPPVAYLRHQAAATCAATILEGKCSLFIFAEGTTGHRTIRNRPPGLEGFEGLKSVK